MRELSLLQGWTLFKSAGTLFNTGEGVPGLPFDQNLSEALHSNPTAGRGFGGEEMPYYEGYVTAKSSPYAFTTLNYILIHTGL